MARSPKYDQWEDAGMAFSDTELDAFDLRAWSENHLEEMAERIRVLHRRSTIPDVSKPEWTKKACKVAQDKLTWFVIASGLPSVNLEAVLTLPDPKTVEGKALTSAAQSLEPLEWVGAVRAELVSDLRIFVTTCRRLSSVSKAEKSQANKIANALERELAAIDHISGLLDSLPKSKSEREQSS